MTPRPHPSGGWCVAVPAGAGTVRHYVGWWPTEAAAARALRAARVVASEFRPEPAGLPAIFRALASVREERAALDRAARRLRTAWRQAGGPSR